MASFGDYNRVTTNVTAMDAQLSLNKINRDLGESRLRLSTGFKINNAEDDAAGFAIATKLKSRVAGLEQALQNVSDAKSVLGVVEGAYGSIMDNLIEMKSLTTQAANGIIATGSDEMGYIAKQLEGLAADINDIAKSTTYNGINLLSGGDTGTIHHDDDGAGAGTANNGVVDGTEATAPNTGTLGMTFQTGEGTSDTLTVTLNAVNTGTLFGDANMAEAAHVEDTSFTFAIMTAATHYGALDVADTTVTAAHMRSFTSDIDDAIGQLNGYMNQVGIDQRSLSGKEVNLTEAITANSAAKSRIMDTDFAKEQSNSIRLQILQQTATAALSQANMGPQAVLGFLG
jgi:flagellin